MLRLARLQLQRLGKLTFVLIQDAGSTVEYLYALNGRQFPYSPHLFG